MLTLVALVLALTLITVVATRHLRHQAAERKANEEAAAEWFRMCMRNGGLLSAACQELWGKLLKARLNNTGGYDAKAASLLEEFTVRCRALARQRKNGDPLLYLAWTTREELIAARDLVIELRRRGIGLTTPHGEASDGRRLLYAKVRLPQQETVGGFQVQPLQVATGRTIN